MTIDDVSRILDVCISAPYASIQITWHGGEPLLAGYKFFEHAFSLARRLGQDRGIEISQGLQTNGTIINSDWISLFRKHDIRVGVSIDGSEKAHDQFRRFNSGKPSFQSVVRALELLREAEVEVGCLAVVPEDPELFELFVEFVATQRFAPLNLEICFTPSGPKDPDGYGTRFARLFKMYINKVNPRYFRPVLFESIVDSFLFGRSRLCWINGTCARHVGIDPAGAVSPCCDRLTGPKYAFGSLHSATLLEILSNPVANDFWQAERERHPDCLKCEWQFVCKSGCTYHRVKSSGDPGGLDSMCSFYKIFFSECNKIILESTQEPRSDEQPAN